MLGVSFCKVLKYVKS